MSDSNTKQQESGGSALEINLENDQATENLGRALAQALVEISGEGSRPSAIIFLSGELGAGKTTLSRGVLRFFAYQGAVKSPTYTLVEPYELESVSVFHFDLYRLSHPEELHYLGFEDYFTSGNICLLEWPAKAGDFLPDCDIEIKISIKNDGRIAQICAFQKSGEKIIERLNRLISKR